MAVKIRLKRMGANKRPFYRIVAADSRTPRDGRTLDTLGYYDPMTEPSTIRIDSDKAKLWLGRGAQATDTVRRLLTVSGVLSGPQTAAPEAEAVPAEAVVAETVPAEAVPAEAVPAEAEAPPA